MSNFFPKYSPDGKWIVFCKAKSYMLLQPDSELYIVPAAGGVARRLRYNTARMNSWHSWSSNSRWLVFSSKVNTPYTQLFLTHIDENGNDSPPVLLERFTSPDRAANIPEFVKLPGDAIADIREQFLDPYSFLRAGMANEHTGDHKGAERAYRRGLEHRSGQRRAAQRARDGRCSRTGGRAEAVAEYKRALAVDPEAREGAQQPGARAGGARRARGGGRVTSRRRSRSSPRRRSTATSDSPWRGSGKPEEALRGLPEGARAGPELRVGALQPGRDASCRRASSRRPSPTTARRFPGRPTAETHNGLGYVLARQGRHGRGDRGVPQGDRRRPELHARLQQPRRSAGEAGEARRSGGVLPALARGEAERRPCTTLSARVLRKLGKTDEAADQFGKAQGPAVGAVARSSSRTATSQRS